MDLRPSTFSKLMGKLNTIVVTASVSRLAGGTFTSVRRLHQALQESSGININVFGLQDEFTGMDLALWRPLTVETFPASVTRQFGYSPRLLRALLEVKADIVHTHGIWMYPSVAVSNWHRKTRKPYLVSLHGMLDPWAIRNSAWKKKLALFLYEKEHLENAACLRALCESEANAIRAFGLNNPIAIIPNGIDLPVLTSANILKPQIGKAPWSDLCPPASGKNVLLFLSRVHPKKGLINLIEAWAMVNRKSLIANRQSKEWVLALAGWDQGGHENELKSLATELAIPWADIRATQSTSSPHRDKREGQGEASNVVSDFRSLFAGAASLLFLGPQFNEGKQACYANCDAFILPSVSEGLPMVVLEAWAYGKPVVMTPECNLPEGFAENAAIRIESNVESIAHGLDQLFRSPSSDLSSMGTNGRQLVGERFAWPKIAREMKSVYDWILGSGCKPECLTLTP